MTPAEILDRAADVIDERGWGQGSHGSPPLVGVCALRAISIVDGRASTVHETLSRAVGGFVYLWNDAPGRTKDEVTSTMRAVAATLRAQADNTPIQEKVTA